MSTTQHDEQGTRTTTMRAMVVPEWGGPEVLEERDVAVPEPGPTEIRVAVQAAGVNPVDWKSRRTGSFGLWGDPVVVGWDVAGVVEAVGPGASLFRVGDEVMGMPRFPHQAGAYAERVVAPSRQFVLRPAGLTAIEAAALPLVGLTAWQGLVEVARVGPGTRVLIHGGGGGLGHVAVQVAKARGAHVVATASAPKHEWLRGLGADEVVDYRAVPVAEAASGVDVAFDAVGGADADGVLATVRDGGTLIAIPGGVELSPAGTADAEARGVRAAFVLVEPDRHGLLALVDLVDRGLLRPTVAETFALADAARAHATGEAGGTAGKLVLRVG